VDQLAQALEKLPEVCREVVRLRHLHGWPIADIARHVGRTPSAVATLLCRGLKQMRTLLEDRSEP
jgi:RNA polymerase sigma-70 factor (ECF subfamily)